MKYYFEYKIKNGSSVGGHNLDDINFFDDYLTLSGFDIYNTNYGLKKEYWSIRLDVNEIEYLKIEPILPISERSDKCDDKFFKI